MRGEIEPDENFWKVSVNGRIRFFSDLDRALEGLRKEIVKEVSKWGKEEDEKESPHRKEDCVSGTQS